MTPTRRTILLVAWALLVAGVVLLFDRIIAGRGFEAFDAETYLAAGERLNAGHALYALAPGDRPILTNPAFYTYPLLSPPPIAVLWRPLAALPAGWGIGLWWLACIASVVATLGFVFRRLPVLAGLSVLLFAPFAAWELESGNVEGLFFAGIAGVWLLAARRRDFAAGALVGVMAGIKLWPIVLLIWFVGQKRRRAIGGAALALVAVGLVSVAGAGLQAHIDYLGITRQTAPSPLSLPGMLRAAGLNLPWANYAVLVLGAGLVLVLRGRPELAFAVVIPTMILGSPVVNINTYALMLMGLVPFVSPANAWVDGLERRTARNDGTIGLASAVDQGLTIWWTWFTGAHRGTVVRGRGLSLLVAARVAVVVSMLALLGGLLAFWLLAGAHPGDAYTYLAAGQRLNAGHLLYALSPGDSEVLLNPPYWTVPLLSPPLVGVIWRPLALLPGDAGVYVWWLAVVASSGAVIVALLVRAPLVTVPLLLGLSISIVVQVGVANIDGMLLLGIVSVWWLTIRGHERAAGAIIGIMTAVKVTPLVLLWWLVTLGRWRGLQACAVAIAVSVIVGVIGAGVGSHLQFLEIAVQTSASGSSPGSLAGLARGFGVAPELARYLPGLAMIVGATLMVVWRGRPGLTFGIASVLMVIGSPSVNVHTPALLLATLAPFAWPLLSRATIAAPQPGTASMAPHVA